ncbi:MAG: hypothetical protein ABIF18_03745 [archaeon]
MSELSDINQTLKDIENKIEDKSGSKSIASWTSRFFDYSKSQEESRREREEKRGKELLELQKVQTKSISRQENFNKIIAFTGSILALVAIYSFIIGIVNPETNLNGYWIINIVFSLLVLLCLGPLVKFVIDFWTDAIFGKK